MNQNDTKDTRQKTGWGIELRLGPVMFMLQWIGLFERWYMKCEDNSTMSYWICLYSRRTTNNSMISLIISPLKISLAW